MLTCTGPAWGRCGLALSLQPVSDCACFMSSAKASLSFAAALELAPPLLGRLLGSFFEGTFGRKLCAWPSISSHSQRKERGFQFIVSSQLHTQEHLVQWPLPLRVVLRRYICLEPLRIA